MGEKEPYIEILIAKHLAGEASRQEEMEFEQWLDGSEDNRKYFDDLKVIYSTAGNLKEWQVYDTDKAWKELNIGNQETKVISIRRNTQWLAVAASVIIVATLSYLFFFNPTSPETPSQAWSTQTIAEVKQDTLPDGTLAFLNKSTELIFNFDSKDNLKKVSLEGEAYFDIENEKEERFQIEIDELIIEDIGTSFNVNAYPGSELVTVLVEKGEVALYTLTDPGIRVKAGETGIYNKTTSSFALISETDLNAIAYKTRYFSFNNTLMENVISSLEDVYDIKINLGNERLKQCRITVTFKDEEIDDIAEIIAATLELEFHRIDEKTIEFKGDGCNQ